MNTLERRQISTPYGPAILAGDHSEDGFVLTAWGWGTFEGKQSTHPVLVEAERQSEEYFEGKRHTFDVPLVKSATPFQQKLRQAMIDIPFGGVKTYGELAHEIGSAPRAIGQGCGRNPIPVIVPCHRVVGQGGSLVGYSLNGTPNQEGLTMKAALVTQEQRELLS